MVISAVTAPVLSSIALIATVVPCRNKDASAKRACALSMPVSMPSTNESGVVKVLPKRKRPFDGSNDATSVKVPPMSVARHTPLPLTELVAEGTMFKIISDGDAAPYHLIAVRFGLMNLDVVYECEPKITI